MILVWVHFLENVLQHKGSCGSQLLAAKKLNPNWCDRSVGGAGGRDATSPKLCLQWATSLGCLILGCLEVELKT
jgi:hypothetical protein